MQRKDLLELKKRFKKDDCTFTKVCGCFVNSEKNILLEFRETFLNLNDDDYFKYLEITKKVLSGTIGNNILRLDFLNDEEGISNKQLSFMQLKKSKLEDSELLDNFYKSIIDNYDYPENYLILLFHDVYDVITKTTDNLKTDESDEVFEYVLCAICPVSLSAPGLSYYEEENKIKSRLRDWVVNPPINGFVYPAFINRGADVNSVMYYTKNTKDIHPELMEDILGCLTKKTSALQKDEFQSIIKDSISTDEEESNMLYMTIQENLNNMVEDYKSMSDDTDYKSIKLTKSDLQNILIDSGIPKEDVTKVESYYEESFNDDLPLANSLIDKRTIKANEQFKKEKALKKQVKLLKNQLEEVNSKNSIDEDYDIVLQVKPEKASEIQSKIIDGQEYILIPVNENEKTRINEVE